MDADALRARASALCSDGGAALSGVANRAAPFVLHGAVSAAAHAAVLALCHGMWLGARVSCASRGARLAGLASVGLASAAAGQASAALARWRDPHPPPPPQQQPPGSPWQRRAAAQQQHQAFRSSSSSSHPGGGFFAPVLVEDLATDALLGCALFLVCGGKLGGVLPSDVRFVGALARESLPAPGAGYASDAQRLELARLLRRHGCHHCGSRAGAVTADHQPPNKTVFGSSAAALAAAAEDAAARAAARAAAAAAAARAGASAGGGGGGGGRRKAAAAAAGRAGAAAAGVAALLRSLRSLLQLQPGSRASSSSAAAASRVRQRYYPQCRRCSGLQGEAVRRDVASLVGHNFGGRMVVGRPGAGALVGLRHFSQPPGLRGGTSVEALGGGGGGGGGGGADDGRRRQR